LEEEMVNIELLKRTELFEGLVESQLHEILSHSITKSYPERESLFIQGEEANHIFILIKGAIDLTVKTKEQMNFIASKIEKEGAVFGTASLVKPFRYNVSATCLIPSEVLMIDAQWLRNRMKEDPKMGFEIMERLATLYFNRLNELRLGVYDLIKMSGKS